MCIIWGHKRRVSMDFVKQVLPQKLLKESESTPVELTRLSTSSQPLRSLTVLRETKQAQDKEGLHVDWKKKKDNKPGQKYKSKRAVFTVNYGAQGFLVQMGKLWKRQPLNVTEIRATTSELSLWAVNCQRLRDYPGEAARYAWNTLIFCSYFLLLFFCSWSLLENIWQQPVPLFLQSYVKLTKVKRKCMQTETVTLPKLQPNKRE